MEGFFLYTLSLLRKAGYSRIPEPRLRKFIFEELPIAIFNSVDEYRRTIEWLDKEGVISLIDDMVVIVNSKKINQVAKKLEEQARILPYVAYCLERIAFSVKVFASKEGKFVGVL